LAKDILSKAEAAKEFSRSKGHGEMCAIEKIDKSTLAPLLLAAQEPDPSLLFVIGMAYLWDLVDVDAESTGKPPSEGKPCEVTGAKLALPYLDTAEKLGHSGAAKELFRAHRTLAMYYKDVAAKEALE